ncbi:5'-nucleotidase C-terminal domain-containing protein [Paenisporosarcina quisquiliarum]|uniref:5'-nucleotidase C-terminal domain-containing protein n=1 Tax=Paenisporosarcina quisquiliarum TaxID=365346 RepID=A0A9X3RE12_9BACL|nr:5'-nucleotidase C-terminal domain-containing protein [Paenisporosarcina quisquiliarum]MCZ8536883.1 5'-nucleotidase C-terminal domain-containing protein [Paenisporosarcina quisquiliarum]
MKLRILHTNDLHSNFDNFSRMATLISTYKNENTITLDGGDFADFKSIELQGTKGIAAIELLEEVGYDALTIGNNEMFNGVETLEHMASHSSVPFISNNLVKKELSNLKGVVSSTIVVKNGLRILITGSSPDMGVFNEGLGIHVYPFKEMIANEIKHNEGHYDLCILLSHIGTVADEDVAKDIPEIDIILSAHDHQLYSEAKIAHGTIMNSAGNYGEYLGIVDIEISADKGVELIYSATLPTKQAEIDERIVFIMKENKAKAITALSRPLYDLKEPLWHDVLEENPLTNLIVDGLKDMLGCKIGLMNSGIANAGLFHNITNKKLIEVCPSPLNPTSFEVKGKDIKLALAQSLDAQVCLADGRGPGFRGKFVGRLHISGADILHDGKTIKRVMIGEREMEDDIWYTVASSDYLQRGSGYPSLAHNRNDRYRAEEIKDVIREYANQSDFVERAKVNRWKQLTTVNV